jgi:hypothetical protein
MTSTDEIIRRELESDDKEIRRAIESGGLPTEAEVVTLYRDLTGVLEQLERLTWRVEGIARSDVGKDLPFDVSLEQIGAVAMLTDDVEREIETLTSLNGRARNAMSSLTAIRAEQQFRKR